MGFSISSTHSDKTKRLAVAFVGAVALVLQPFVPLNIPAAFAASLSIAPTSHQIDESQTKVSTIDASSHQNLSLSFTYDAGKLEVGDSLVYGWRANGGSGNQLGIIAGATGNPGAGESGTKNHSLPVEAAISNLEIYFTNTGTTSGAGDRVDINSVLISGDVLSVIEPELTAQDFATWDNSPSFKGFNVGFAAHNFGEVTSVTVDVLRADGSHVLRTAGPDMLAFLSNVTTPTSASTSFVVQPGTSDGLTSSSWWSEQTDLPWTDATMPQSVTITVVGENGTQTVTNSTFNQGPPSWPLYEDFIVPTVGACNASIFDSGFTLGSVNGQNGWKVTSPNFDQEIVDNVYGYAPFGCKTLRISNSYTSGSFGDQTFSAPAAALAGENVTNDHYEAEFSFGTTEQALQADLAISVSPDDGNGNRMSYVSLADTAGGTALTFFDTNTSGAFVATSLGTVARDQAHTIKFVIDMIDGASNDVVEVYLDGALVHAGTTWEQYYRLSPEQAGNGNVVPSIDRLLFRASGTARPANDGKGYVIDGVSVLTSQSVVPDTEAPSAPVISTPVNEQYFKTTPISNQWSASTDNVGVVNYQVAYRYDDGHTFGGSTCPGVTIGGLAVSGCRDTTSTSRNHGPSTSEQGGVTIWVRAYDAAGNVSDWSTPVHYYYDGTNPVLTVSNLNNGDLIRTNNTGNKLTIKGAYSDNVAANYTVFYLIKDGVLVNTQMLYGAKPAGSTLAEFDAAALGLADGMYELQINATDLAGNIASQTINFELDNSAPVVAFTAPAEGTVTNQPVAIRGTVTDENPRHYWLQVKRNGSVIHSQTTLISASFTDQLLRNVTAEGVYEVTLAARDSVGGTASSGNRSGDVVLNFTIDTTAPGMPAHESPANNSSQNVNDFYFEWSDVAGAVEYEYQTSQNPSVDGNGVLNSGVWNNKLHGGADRNYLTESKIHSYGANGTWHWQVRTIDAAGNKSAWTEPWTMTIDMSAPAAPTNLKWTTSGGSEMSSGEVTNDANGAASWDASSSSDVMHYVYKYWNDIAGNQYKPGSEYIVQLAGTNLPGVFNQGEGTHHFCTQAVDHAGNTSSCTQFTITYDATPPALTLNSVVNSTSTSRTISGTSEPFASIEVTVHSTPQTKSTTADASGNWSLLFEGLETGGHTVRVVSTDVTGNVSEQTSSFTVFSVTPVVQLFVPPTLAVTPVVQPFTQGFIGNNPSEAVSPSDDETVAVTDSDASDDSIVLSAQDDGTGTPLEDTEVLGLMDEKFFGLVWYWWLIVLAALIGGWLLIAAAIRRSRNQE